MVIAEYRTAKLRRKCKQCGKWSKGKIVFVESFDGYDPGSYHSMYFCCKECAKRYVERSCSIFDKEKDEKRELNDYIFSEQ